MDFKLDPSALTQSPDEVFDIVGKLGEGYACTVHARVHTEYSSYGCVHKAVYRATGAILAIKQVPVDTDLQEIIKEISIMQQCHSPHVVKYYGSYFKDADLWIVMEYCGGGSVSDIMRHRKQTLTEPQMAPILRDTLLGLEYLHSRSKIHRDVKAGNILLNIEGHAKLADFGVAGQLTDTMAKRNTVIGTPFWMAPEVIQEVGYDCMADIWSLGITCLEMAEGRPPHADIHPMRAIFMIPTRPAPTVRQPQLWTNAFVDFLSCCLVKAPDERQPARELLTHPFIMNAGSVGLLVDIIEEAAAAAAANASREPSVTSSSAHSDDDEDDGGGTMVRHAVAPFGENAAGGGTSVFANVDDATLQSARALPPRDLIDGHDIFHTASLPSASMKKYDSNGGRAPTTNASTLADSTGSGELFARPFADDDFSFVRELSDAELEARLANLDTQMDSEIRELKHRYHTKRQPIIDAIEMKKQRMHNF